MLWRGRRIGICGPGRCHFAQLGHRPSIDFGRIASAASLSRAITLCSRIDSSGQRDALLGGAMAMANACAVARARRRLPTRRPGLHDIASIRHCRGSSRSLVRLLVQGPWYRDRGLACGGLGGQLKPPCPASFALVLFGGSAGSQMHNQTMALGRRVMAMVLRPSAMDWGCN